MDIQDDYTNDSNSNSEIGRGSWFLYRVAQEAIVHGYVDTNYFTISAKTYYSSIVILIDKA
jgi:hypothetical protein